ncbi:hypothetical protein B0H12DRAFT_595882 [Mycena haematopus]|nr:hypothetical protein B0H12DRAFT_595882 [Mycena haematopus]
MPADGNWRLYKKDIGVLSRPSSFEPPARSSPAPARDAGPRARPFPLLPRLLVALCPCLSTRCPFRLVRVCSGQFASCAVVKLGSANFLVPPRSATQFYTVSGFY